MKKRHCAPGPWRASRGSIATIAVIVFLGVSARPVFAETVSSPAGDPTTANPLSDVAYCAIGGAAPERTR